MSPEGDRNHRGRMLPRSYPYAGENTTEIFCIRNSGVLKGKKFANDI